MGLSRNVQKVFWRAVVAQLQFSHYVMWCVCVAHLYVWWRLYIYVKVCPCVWGGGTQDREQRGGMHWWRSICKRSASLGGYMCTHFDGVAQGCARLCTFWSMYVLWECVHLSMLVWVWSLFKAFPALSQCGWKLRSFCLWFCVCAGACVWEKARECVKERGSDGVRKKISSCRGVRDLWQNSWKGWL